MKKFSALWLFVVGILSFVAVYLSEITLGVIATVPFLVIVPPVCYLLYRRQLHIVGLFAFAAFFFKLVFVSDVKRAVLFALFCAFFATASITAVKLLIVAKASVENKKKKLNIISGIIFLVLFIIYFIVYGTFFGNISFKNKNIAFIQSTYPDEKFILGNTYFSVSDFCYITEFGFFDNELYNVKISAKNEDTAKIDGYRDYCVSRLSEGGLSKLRAYISNYAHEGEDFAIRRDNILSADTLYADFLGENYYADMTYEIAFYRYFSDNVSFEEQCRQYLAYIPEEFEYNKITFYGLSEKGKFEFAAEYNRSLEVFTLSDSVKFNKYFSSNDTHKYWTLIK